MFLLGLWTLYIYICIELCHVRAKCSFSLYSFIIQVKWIRCESQSRGLNFQRETSGKRACYNRTDTKIATHVLIRARSSCTCDRDLIRDSYRSIRANKGHGSRAPSAGALGYAYLQVDKIQIRLYRCT